MKVSPRVSYTYNMYIYLYLAEFPDKYNVYNISMVLGIVVISETLWIIKSFANGYGYYSAREQQQFLLEMEDKTTTK